MNKKRYFNPIPHYIKPTFFEMIKGADWFQPILLAIKTLASLQTLFDQVCPTECVGHCRVLGMTKQCLALGVDNANWALRIRYHSAILLIALSAYPAFQDVRKIHISIAPLSLPSLEK